MSLLTNTMAMPIRALLARQQGGAALLSAMLTVTLVATFASAALWQQFRNFEIENAERGRLQSALVLTGALDWARLILREDARTGGADHLAEPWAVPLEEARLASFLAVNDTAVNTDRNAFLSGSMTDMQGRLNVTNLVDGNAASEVGLAAFKRLFELLDLPPLELAKFTENYITAVAGAAERTPSAPALSGLVLPQRVDQLIWLGLEARTLVLLEPHISLLPIRTPVNLNTASAVVIAASTPGLDVAVAEKLIATRARKHFTNLAEANQSLGNPVSSFKEGLHSVASNFFEVRGELRLDQLSVAERSLVQRNGSSVKTLWRTRGVRAEPAKGQVRS